MEHITVMELLHKIDDLYNGNDEDDESPKGSEARIVLEGVVKILSQNSDVIIP